MKKSRVPQIQNMDPAHFNFLDAVDRRQLTVSQLEDLSSTATTTEIITLVNAILAAHRTK